MDFVNIEFPQCLAFDAQSDPTWSTTLTAVIGGYEITNQNWSQARHTFDVILTNRKASEYQLALEHFHTMRGRAKSFPFKDFLDFEVSASQGLLLDDDGVAPAGNATFGLHKRYGSGGDAYDRRITRPDSPIQVFRTRSSSTTDITGSGAAVTYAGGTVAITGHMSGDTYSWSGTFKVPCRYDVDKLPAAVINRSDGELIVSCGPILLVEVRE